MVVDTTVHDRSGLLLPQSPPPTDADINQAELIGIAMAGDWVKRSRLDVRSVRFWQRLHKEMFAEIWDWAGNWRHSQPNIGVPPQDIQPQLKRLQDDLAFWLSENSDMLPLEILARFHHRVVYIHPFVNGNGRWGRLVADALAIRQFELGTLNWAIDSENFRGPESPGREEYVATMKAGDKGDFRPLMAYLLALNPELA